jgi:hypothetical protein
MRGYVTRRALVKGGLIASTLIPVGGLFATAARSASSELDPSDPIAKTLGYVAKSTKPDANCANCSQFQGKQGDATGPCTVFSGKSVASAGWCMSWVKKVAA